jgi:glycosyltransferase involved in cell wall biosynthesis
MRILKVIHGYPPLYNAGSEVYSQMLCHGLAKHHEVHVFTREENSFAEDFSLNVICDTLVPTIKLHCINIPGEKYRYRYQHSQVDQVFEHLIKKIQPEIVHIGHLSHLSTSLIFEIVKQNIPIIYTLHDYWLMCPRGQFIQRNAPEGEELWALCDGQKNQKCAERCYAGYFSGAHDEINTDVNYWTGWVDRRMEHIRNISEKINYFIAPSRYLYRRYVKEFGLPEHKIIYLDYGFDLQRLKNRQRGPDTSFTFGYIGTHIPAKGIQHLIAAFGLIKGDCQLFIWGRSRSQNTEGLQAIVASLPQAIQARIKWLPEYRNEHIVNDVFNRVDCIVVPSIWVENSPLVIHEALQVRLPVITANAGGMAEYVQHEKNGLLFEHRNVQSLAAQMQRLVDDPPFARQLGARGYLQSCEQNIPDMDSHIASVAAIYKQALQEKTLT